MGSGVVASEVPAVDVGARNRAPSTVAHRRGRRSRLIPAVSGSPAPWASMVEIAQDEFLLARVAGQARLTGRIWDRDDATVRVSTLTVADARDWDPDELLEVRRPASHKGKQSYAGRVTVPTQWHEVRAGWFESLNEYHHFLDVLLTRLVAAMATQPFEVSWATEVGIRTHIPDALFRCVDGSRTVVDVTSQDKLTDPRVRAVFLLTRATAAALGWGYELRVEMPPQREHNLRFIWAHRHASRAGASAELFEAAALPQSVWQLLQSLGVGVGAEVIWSAVAAGTVAVDLNRPLRPDSTVTRHLPGGRPSWLVNL